jgi:hypothetical protein
MERFKMPCLSRYWCWEDGKIQNAITGKYLTAQNGWYSVFDDKFDRIGITPKEIDHYFKHLMQHLQCRLSKQTETVTYRNVIHPFQREQGSRLKVNLEHT